LDFSLSNITLQIYLVNDYYRFIYVLKQDAASDVPVEKEARTKHLHSLFADFYGQTIRPLFELASVSSGFEVGQLWGQIPTYLNYYMEHFKAESDEAEFHSRLDSDYGILLHELEPSIFGRKKHPLNVKVRMIEDARDPNKQVRMKNACCLYYKTEGGIYCYTCPRNKEEDRVAFRERLKEEAQAAALK
jgi:ferric iron reductase protein FhuF